MSCIAWSLTQPSLLNLSSTLPPHTTSLSTVRMVYLHWHSLALALALYTLPTLGHSFKKDFPFRNSPLAPQMTIGGRRCPSWAGGWIQCGGMHSADLNSTSTFQHDPAFFKSCPNCCTLLQWLTAATFHPTPGCHPLAGKNIPSFNKWSEEPLEGTGSVQHHWGQLAWPLPCFWNWSFSWLFFPQLPLSMLHNTVCWWD